jgi:CheY-like chemotaxis protein
MPRTTLADPRNRAEGRRGIFPPPWETSRAGYVQHRSFERFSTNFGLFRRRMPCPAVGTALAQSPIMKNILVVDDNIGLANVMAATLSAYQVTITHTAPEALARATMLSSCDLLITDYVMPGMDGDVLAGRVREIHPAAKTLLVSGFADYITLNNPRALDFHLAKPFSPVELRETVGALIGKP